MESGKRVARYVTLPLAFVLLVGVVAYAIKIGTGCSVAVAIFRSFFATLFSFPVVLVFYSLIKEMLSKGFLDGLKSSRCSDLGYVKLSPRRAAALLWARTKQYLTLALVYISLVGIFAFIRWAESRCTIDAAIFMSFISVFALTLPFAMLFSLFGPLEFKAFLPKRTIQQWAGDNSVWFQTRQYIVLSLVYVSFVCVYACVIKVRSQCSIDGAIIQSFITVFPLAVLFALVFSEKGPSELRDLVPKRIREDAFDPSFNDLKAEFLVKKREARSKLARTWLRLRLTGAGTLVVIQCYGELVKKGLSKALNALSAGVLGK